MSDACLFDDYPLADAKALARAGELATRALEEESDRLAIASVFRAIADHLEIVERCMDAGRAELRVLKAKAKP